MLRFLTVREAAEASPLKEERIRQALRSKELHGAQAGKGGSWHIAEPCLEAYLLGEKCPHQAKANQAA